MKSMIESHVQNMTQSSDMENDFLSSMTFLVVYLRNKNMQQMKIYIFA